MAGRNLCIVPACRQVVEAYGYCRNHSRRLRKYGDPLAGPTFWGAPAAWLEANVSRSGSACLTWLFHRKANGYGELTRSGSRKRLYAHREMCILANGPPPTPKHEAAHSCGKGHEGCVHPRHVRWDTAKGNHADRLRHGTHTRGSKNGRAKLSEDDVLAIRALTGMVSTSEIARRFSISHKTAWSVLERQNWRWLP